MLNNIIDFLKGLFSSSETVEPKKVVEVKKVQIPTVDKLKKFTKVQLLDFADRNDITVSKNKTKAVIIKEIRSSK
tara:strand:+ start:1488 stop:1712 length:225 start_codon:yes stop_codon:yes gene_type:complete